MINSMKIIKTKSKFNFMSVNVEVGNSRASLGLVSLFRDSVTGEVRLVGCYSMFVFLVEILCIIVLSYIDPYSLGAT
jgi:hypothetical protein